MTTERLIELMAKGYEGRGYSKEDAEKMAKAELKAEGMLT